MADHHDRVYGVVTKQAGEWPARSRERGGLEALLALCRQARASILATPKADYLWRIMVTEDDLRAIMLALAGTIDYPNLGRRRCPAVAAAQALSPDLDYLTPGGGTGQAAAVISPWQRIAARRGAPLPGGGPHAMSEGGNEDEHLSHVWPSRAPRFSV